MSLISYLDLKLVIVLRMEMKPGMTVLNDRMAK